MRQFSSWRQPVWNTGGKLHFILSLKLQLFLPACFVCWFPSQKALFSRVCFYICGSTLTDFRRGLLLNSLQLELAAPTAQINTGEVLPRWVRRGRAAPLPAAEPGEPGGPSAAPPGPSAALQRWRGSAEPGSPARSAATAPESSWALHIAPSALLGLAW